MGAVAKSYMTNGLLSPHIWLNICAFSHIVGSPSSFMTMQPRSHLNFLFYEENFFFFFISVW
jgi:hypothetical protein